MERYGAIAEVSDLVLAAGPVNLATAANNGRWVSMKETEAMNAILISGIGTAGEDPIISLEQAKDAAGTGAKVLQLKSVHYKVATGGAFAAATDRWKRVDAITDDAPANTYSTVAIDGAENECIVTAYVRAADLDLVNGFTHIRLICADVGAAAQLGTLLYVPAGRAYKGAHNSSRLA